MPRGILVSFDGPGGAGKTTVINHLAALLATRGTPIHTTAEPSNGPIGQLARALVQKAEGWELACLFAADRYEHLRTEILPLIHTGHVVLCDRYLASGLVVQRMDGIDLPYLTAINRYVEQPDLAVILTARPAVIQRRVARRGAHNRYQTGPNAAAAELAYYAEAADYLHAEGMSVTQIDTTDIEPAQVAAALADAIDRIREDTLTLEGAA
jgi:dTMP kinase